MFQLNCHLQGAYTCIAKTNSDKIVLQCNVFFLGNSPASEF